MKHKHISKFALVTAFWLFSCTSVERDNCLDSGGINYMMGCQLSSSSVEPSSSSSYVIKYGESVLYKGEIYETVEIGTQTWMAKNLNYNAPGSKCNNYSDANCATYGRLYDWNTAIKVCPSGWHLPSDAEWRTLTNFVGSPEGKYLKATSGWNSNGNGTDKYGFSALPGGCSGRVFWEVGNYGIWWSATEYSASYASSRYIYYDSDAVYKGSNEEKDNLYSVRCVQD
ncbi:MAG: fibrobacter succinogenes major paralogous domain-containing protein [Fibromonadaceae bacterium]|jgi:uncharacterized protein (TIGR02145 family)|nr:fibrobacter succinogenes major paralogous domain-containing protein [Fibromonadaceae bacterium]